MRGAMVSMPSNDCRATTLFSFQQQTRGREAIGEYTIAFSATLLGRSLLAFCLPTALT